MLIDPFYKNIQICLFQSSSMFDVPRAKLTDLFYKTIIYKTPDDTVKLAIQFKNMVYLTKMKELDQLDDIHDIHAETETESDDDTYDDDDTDDENERNQ